MNRLVYYSISASRETPRPDLVWQIEQSIKSLRAHNTTVEVVVFTYGDVPPELAPALAPYGVKLHHKGSYLASLARLSPRGWQILSQYPLLHKFLNFREIALLDPDQVLFVDCDTLFFADVEILFSRYAEADCYGREEPTCRRSHYGYNSIYIDEDALVRLGQEERIVTPPPFNLGVVAFNHRIWQKLAELDTVFLSYAWRFSVWMSLHSPEGMAASYGEGQGIEYLRQYFDQLADEEDVQRALSYPSANRWILDQVALWLTVGHVPGFKYEDFALCDVLQNGEILSKKPNACDWIVCHYFSQNTARIVEWMNQPPGGSVDALAQVSAVLG